jgi:glucose/arabinose dehydrogenase
MAEKFHRAHTAAKAGFLMFVFVVLLATCLSAAPNATPLTTIRVADGLTRPVFVCAAPGDTERLFIVEQDGRIKILKGGTVLSRPFLDVSAIVRSIGNEQGLLGLAFHPQYSSNGYFYVNYTDNNGDTRVSRFRVSSDPDSADVSSEFNILFVDQPFSNHNGGMLAFGPNDGYLYISLGDGGSGGDPGDRAQSDNTLLGKILRIDVDGGNPYTIPPDNPFSGSPSVLGEIWAKGLRNPWRYSFDRATGDMYIGDVGQGDWEEIDYEPASGPGGINYGWRCYEGNHEYNTTDCSAPSAYQFPVTEYSHSLGCSVTGGYVYRGCAIPDLQGTYFFADYCSGNIWTFLYDGITVTEYAERSAELAPGGGLDVGGIVSFGEDAHGELYICDLFDGEVFKIVPDGVAPVCGFLCGDANSDGNVNLLDILFLIDDIYGQGPSPAIPEAADVNNSGDLNLLDILAMISFIYDNGPALDCPQ